jgi:hypothetical protein
VLNRRFLVFETDFVVSAKIAGHLPAPFYFSQAYLPHFAAITDTGLLIIM